MLPLYGCARSTYYDPARFCGIFDVPASNDVFSLSGYFVWDPTVFLIGGTYYLIYGRWPSASGENGYLTAGEIAYATASSPEGPFTHQAVLLTAGGGWDDLSITNPKVIHDGSNWRIYYTGYNSSLGNHPAACVATATDITGPYTKSVNNPVIPRGLYTDWDNDIDNPAPIVVGGTYYVYYKGGTDYTGLNKIGLATASNWEGPFTKYAGNPVIDVYPDRWEDPNICYENGIFKLIMVAPAGDAYVGAHGTIWAWSNDGMTFYQPPFGYKCYEAPMFGTGIWAAERTTFLDNAIIRKYMYVAKHGSSTTTSIGYAVFLD